MRGRGVTVRPRDTGGEPLPVRESRRGQGVTVQCGKSSHRGVAVRCGKSYTFLVWEKLHIFRGGRVRTFLVRVSEGGGLHCVTYTFLVWEKLDIFSSHLFS